MEKYKHVLLDDDLKMMAIQGMCPLSIDFKNNIEKVNYYYIFEQYNPISTDQIIDKLNTFKEGI